MQAAAIAFLPPAPCAPRQPWNFLADMAASLSSHVDAREVKEVLLFTRVLGGEDIGAFAGAISLLTTYVVPIPVSIDRQRELIHWFKVLARCIFRRGATITLRVDDRCVEVWEKAAEALREASIAAIGDADRAVALGARARLYQAEVDALREHLGMVDREEG